MNHRIGFARVAAVVSAVALLFVYVYDRAGGDILERRGRERIPASSESEFMSGSKSKFRPIQLQQQQTTNTADTESQPTHGSDQSNDRPSLMPGSKSLRMIIPVETKSKKKEVEKKSTRTKVLPGSKAPAMLIEPINVKKKSTRQFAK